MLAAFLIRPRMLRGSVWLHHTTPMHICPLAFWARAKRLYPGGSASGCRVSQFGVFADKYWIGYNEAFAGYPSADVVAEPGERDGFPCHAAFSIGPYSVLIFSQ
ncbi:MAG: hypothetical protein NT169_10700 [Chloroflexi bacterium]|nr:hypothetical protein [Chloroflexota bacterium]